MTLFLGLVIGVAVGIVLSLLSNRRANRIREQRARIAERRAADAERLAELGSLTSGLAHEMKPRRYSVELMRWFGKRIDFEPSSPISCDSPGGSGSISSRRTLSVKSKTFWISSILRPMPPKWS
jgi:hypothetical protein